MFLVVHACCGLCSFCRLNNDPGKDFGVHVSEREWNLDRTDAALAMQSTM